MDRWVGGGGGGRGEGEHYNIIIMYLCSHKVSGHSHMTSVAIVTLT